MDKKSDENSEPSTSKVNDKSTKYQFYKKPSFKKSGPQVKHTKTSLKRIEQANPLLKYASVNLSVNGQGSLQKVENASKILKNPPQKPLSKPRVSNFLAGNGPAQTLRKHGDFLASSTPRMTSAAREEPQKPIENFKVPSMISKATSMKKINLVESDRGRSAKPVKPRRSLSADHFDRNKENQKIVIENASPSQKIAMVFQSPSAHQRRSICRVTPTTTSSRRSFYRPSASLPTLEELQTRLNEWLTKRGKSISTFHYLDNFVALKPVDEENKENIEVDQDLDKGSYEDLRIIKSKNSANWESVAKAALVDLTNLIQEGYPVSQCEEWLKIIRTKYSFVDETPEYWECRAAIEQWRGDLINAVECYKTAIVQGAEVQLVDNSLDVLLQKFSILNINVDNLNVNDQLMKERERIVKDARNVFKSSIIKFAVQEKTLKKDKNQVKLVATPVRRSARPSRSRYSSTPGVTICSTLKELEMPGKVDFVKNKALD